MGLKKVIFSSNIAWSIYNFRMSLLKSLQDDGWQIYTVANKDDYANKFESEGFYFVVWEYSSSFTIKYKIKKARVNRLEYRATKTKHLYKFLTIGSVSKILNY